MAKVTSIDTKLQAKRSNEDMERWKAFFKQQFAGQDKETMDQVYKAIQDMDQKAYMDIVNSIVRRQGMQEMSKEG